MRFMVTFAWKPDARIRDEGIARFKSTGGVPPQGATLNRQNIAAGRAVT